MRRFHYNFKNTKTGRQAGVTLLLAILILSSIMAISFSLATVLLVETRSSGDLLRTEPALYGANAVTEEALFNVKRNAGLSSYSTSLGNLSISSQTSELNDAVQQVIVPPSSTSFANSSNVYLFYDPSNAYAGSGYGGVQVHFIDTGVTGAQLHIYLCDFNPTNAGDNCTSLTEPDGTTPNHTMIYRDSTPLNPGDCWPSCSSTFTFNFANTDQQQLVIFGSGASDNLYANIETFDTGGTPKGLPYFGKTAVQISAGGAGVLRNLRVVIPNPGNSSVANTTDYAAAVNGGSASSSGDFLGGQYPASSAIDGDRKGTGWASGTGGWNDNTFNDWSNDWLAAAFSGAKTLSEVDVYTLADGFPLSSDPSPSDTFTQYGIVDFEVQYSTDNGGSWADVPGGNITGNNLVWKKITFSSISGVTNIRVVVHNSLAGYSRIVELEAY